MNKVKHLLFLSIIFTHSLLCADAFSDAFKVNDLKKMQSILDKHKKIEDINVKCPLGWTPLVFASMMGEVKLVESLLEHNADINEERGMYSAIAWASIGIRDSKTLGERNKYKAIQRAIENHSAMKIIPLVDMNYASPAYVKKLLGVSRGLRWNNDGQFFPDSIRFYHAEIEGVIDAKFTTEFCFPHKTFRDLVGSKIYSAVKENSYGPKIFQDSHVKIKSRNSKVMIMELLAQTAMLIQPQRNFNMPHEGSALQELKDIWIRLSESPDVVDAINKYIDEFLQKNKINFIGRNFDEILINVEIKSLMFDKAMNRVLYLAFKQARQR